MGNPSTNSREYIPCLIKKNLPSSTPCNDSRIYDKDEIVEEFKNFWEEIFTSRIDANEWAAYPHLPYAIKYQDFLFKFIKFCWDEEWIPERWKKSIILLLSKSDQVSYIGNYRPITLLDSDFKILTYVVCLEDSIKHKKDIFICYLDFEKAYDSVEKIILKKTLEYYRVPSQMI
jgi:hypothetical protein